MVVGVDYSSLQVNSRLKLVCLVWGSATTWRCSTFIRWNRQTVTMTLQWQQHHKHCSIVIINRHHQSSVIISHQSSVISHHQSSSVIISHQSSVISHQSLSSSSVSAVPSLSLSLSSSTPYHHCYHCTSVYNYSLVKWWPLILSTKCSLIIVRM